MKHSLNFASALGTLVVFTLWIPGAAYAAPPIDPCALLTPDQISSVLGVKAGPGKRFMIRFCKWIPASPSADKMKQVTLTLKDVQSFAYAKMPIGNGITKTEVSGIGDDAVYVISPHSATTLTVKKGNSVFDLLVTGFPDDQIKAKEKTLALDVIAKL